MGHKRVIIFFSTLLLISATISNGEGQGVPFSKGVNLTGWLQGSSVCSSQLHRYSAEDFKVIRSLGFDVIRLPVNMSAMSSGVPDFILPPLLFEFIDSAITWSEHEGLHLILDNHSFSFSKATDKSTEIELLQLWKQLSKRLANEYSNLYFEILNEPHDIDSDLWGEIQGQVIKEIRRNDTIHSIIVTPPHYAQAKYLGQLPDYKDEKLLYTFHFYHPFLFTHQGTSFTRPSLINLSGLPFPFDESQMPAPPSDIIDTWAEKKFVEDYSTEATVESILNEIDIASCFRNSTGNNVFCGEFGVYRETVNPMHRLIWYSTVSDILLTNDIPWVMWNYRGGFGIFNKNSEECIPDDLNTSLIKALGLKVPLGVKNETDKQSFYVYRDILNRSIKNLSAIDDQTLNLFCDNNPHAGRYCVEVTNLKQYQTIVFSLLPKLGVDHYTQFEFYYLSKDNDVAFEIMISDVNRDFSYSFSKENLVNDGCWHKVGVPLDAFEEMGRWVNGYWIPSDKTARMSSVSGIKVVNNSYSMEGLTFHLDEIRFSKTLTEN